MSSDGNMFHIRRGQGEPVLLVHGLGSTARSWEPILDALAEHRQVIAVDLPGHGRTPALEGEMSMAALADALEAFIDAHELDGIDLVGSSVGARLVIELARRGVGGAVVALDPGGFWDRWGAWYLGVTLGASIRLLRLAAPVMAWLTGNRVTRSLLLAQLSAKPGDIDPGVALRELRSFASTPVFDEVLRQLVHGPGQGGIPAGQAPRMVLVWGCKDRVTPPHQARRAAALIPDAQLRWLEACGHFPHWDRPDATVGLILEATRTDRREAPSR